MNIPFLIAQGKKLNTIKDKLAKLSKQMGNKDQFQYFLDLQGNIVDTIKTEIDGSNPT